MKLISRNVITFTSSALLLMIFVLSLNILGCSNKHTVRVEEEMFDKSLNRVMRKMGFFLITLANSPPDMATYQEFRDEIMVDLQVLRKRTKVLKNEVVLTYLNRIDRDFRKITEMYDDNCNGMQNEGMNNGHAHKKKRCENLKEKLMVYVWPTMMERYEKILAHKRP